MLTDIVSNIYNNLINFITGQNAQDRFVNLLDSSPNILSDASQANGYVSTDANNEMFSTYYNENDSRANIITKQGLGELVGNKFYQINDAVGSTITLQVCAENAFILHDFAIDVQTGEIGTYDITTDVFSPIVSSAQTLSDTLILGNTSGANDIEFDATQGLLFDNASRLREGTIDAGLGGLKGIAQICGAGYELKWENGRLYVMGSSGNTIRQSLYNLTTTPTVTDDDTLGYSVGSLWTLDDGTVYVCSDATTGAAVWAIGGIPTLQQVTDAGFTTTNGIKVDDGVGNYVQVVTSNILMEDSSSNALSIYPDSITIQNPSFGAGTIKATTLAYNVTFELPNKAAGTETFAMLSDVTGSVPYTGATADVDLGIHSLTADTIGIGTPAGAEKLHIDGGASTTRVKIDADNGVSRILSFRTDDVQRWALRVDGIESGANSGGDFQLRRYNDAGAHIDNPIAINRANGNITTAQNINGATPTELGYLSGVGSQVVGTTDTNTLTNKRITARTGTTTSSATPTINTDNVDFYSLTAQTVDITSFTTNLSGTPTDAQTLWIAITGTAARAITWGASFEASTIALPTTTVTTARLDVAFIWNAVTSKWRCVGVA